LAHHYSHSENLVKKRKYLWRAGEAAQAAYANSTALDYYDRLLLLLTDPRERSAIQLKAGAVLELIGRWSEAEARYEEALALAERASDRSARAQCRQALGVLSRQRGDHDAALKWLELAEKDWIFLEDQHGFIRVLTEKGIVFRRKGEYETARQNLETSLDLARGRGDLAGMAMALQQQGVVANLGDYAGTQALYEESLALWRTLGNKEGIASVLNDMGILVSERGEFEAARALYDESLALQRELGDKRGIALALNNLGSLVEEQSNYAAALAFYEESLAFRREMGDKPGIATLLCNLGIVAVEQGNYAKAGALYDESMKLRRETGDKRAIGYCALCQGLLARAEGHLNQAHVLFSEALAQFRETGSKRNIANCLAALTLAAMDPLTATKSLALAERAAQLSGSTDALLRSLKTHLERQFRLPYEHAVAELQAILGNDAFAAARKAGEQMTLEDAIALASAPGIDQA
jgi:tetratricopeptide (TPR) repeat protein